ncbi:DNA-processing protein DprA [Knoellia subterranea]|uniref:DNA processing protein DprA n=1 Tax=Knoellia subterranea KCTC 19937 TaxID=1385521 RepID=A0A0A0JHZ7_9MICO|nr:DNA-processing protein DprA [Knoellia subterranea]KGN36753.1 DNA processing protein DprA [Knoellia subterranea KCTC 19937]
MSSTARFVVPGDDDREQERWARVAWSRVAEPETVSVRDWIAQEGAAESVRRLVSGSLASDGRYDQRVATLDLDQARHALDRLDVRVLIPGDEEWPEALDDLPCPPVCLYVKGTGHLSMTVGSVAVVGSRAATSYGLRVAAELGEELVDRGVAVVSGAAFGIDAAAHRGALAGGGPTVAVLARGLDRAYPQAHAGLLREIADGGAVVSELPPGWAPYRQRFIARNRIIAALGVGTVVVEAGLRSGSLNTAKVARELVRHVAAVPGPVTSVQSAGCHKLLRETGATLVTDAAEVLDLMGRLSLDSVGLARAPVTPESELDPTASSVWSAVPVRRTTDLAGLQRLTALDPATLLSVLGRLAMLGLVERVDGGWRKIPASRR